MGVFWLFPLIPHSHCLEVRASEGDGEKRVGQARQGCLFLHNVCRCCMTRFVTLRATTSQSGTERCGRGTGGDGAGEAGPQRCPRLSEGDGDGDGGALLIVQLSLLIMPRSNQWRRRQEPKWHFSALITHGSFTVTGFFTRMQSLFHWTDLFFPSLIIWFDNWDI